MSALLYVKNTLYEWHEMVHGDYKVSKVAFIFQNETSLKLLDGIVQFWESDNVFYGFVDLRVRTRLSRMMILVPDGKFYRCNKMQCRELAKLANVENDRSNEEYLKTTYEDYLHYLLNND